MVVTNHYVYVRLLPLLAAAFPRFCAAGFLALRSRLRWETSVAKHYCFPALSLHVSAKSWYLAFFNSYTSSVIFSQGTVSSISITYLVTRTIYIYIVVYTCYFLKESSCSRWTLFWKLLKSCHWLVLTEVFVFGSSSLTNLMAVSPVVFVDLSLFPPLSMMSAVFAKHTITESSVSLLW